MVDMTKAHLSENHPVYVQMQEDTEFTTLLASSHRSCPCSSRCTKTFPHKTNTADFHIKQIQQKTTLQMAAKLPPYSNLLSLFLFTHPKISWLPDHSTGLGLILCCVVQIFVGLPALRSMYIAAVYF